MYLLNLLNDFCSVHFIIWVIFVWEIFLLKRNKTCATCDTHFRRTMACDSMLYADIIFDKLNCLNSNLQGKNINILIISDKINVFKTKIFLWKNYTDDDKFEMVHVYRNSIQSFNTILSKVFGTTYYIVSMENTTVQHLYQYQYVSSLVYVEKPS